MVNAYGQINLDKIGEIISEEVYSDDELAALKDSRLNNGIPYREI